MPFKAFTELHHHFFFVFWWDELHFILYLIGLFFMLFLVLSQQGQQTV